MERIRKLGMLAGGAALVLSWTARAETPPKPPSDGAAPSATSAGHPPPIDGEETATTEPRPSFHGDVAALAKNNDAFRRVVYTGDRTQLVVMSLPPGQSIGRENHAHVEQMLVIVRGNGKATLEGNDTPLRAGTAVIVPPGTTHDLVNTGREPLKLYTLYSPPNHIDGRVQKTKADAEADTEDEAFGEKVR